MTRSRLKKIKYKLSFSCLKNADEKDYGGLSKSLKEGSFLANNEYLISIASMHELMVKHSAQNNNTGNINSDEKRRGGIILTQLGEGNRGEIIPGSGGTTITDNFVLDVINLVILHGTVLKMMNPVKVEKELGC